MTNEINCGAYSMAATLSQALYPQLTIFPRLEHLTFIGWVEVGLMIGYPKHGELYANSDELKDVIIYEDSDEPDGYVSLN